MSIFASFCRDHASRRVGRLRKAKREGIMTRS
jgi:hypothetical protein